MLETRETRSKKDAIGVNSLTENVQLTGGGRETERLFFTGGKKGMNNK